LPAPYDADYHWVKADMVYTLSFNRLFLLCTGKDLTGTREYDRAANAHTGGEFTAARTDKNAVIRTETGDAADENFAHRPKRAKWERAGFVKPEARISSALSAESAKKTLD
jgi:hypothetical protein